MRIVAEGSASLTPDGSGRCFDEALSYEFDGKRIAATRRYHYYDGPAGALVATFADGSPFFTALVGADGTGHAIHHCGDDRYDLAFSLGPDDRWMTAWRVTGTKRLSIVSVFSRAT